MVEDAVEAVLEVVLVGGSDAMAFVRHPGQQWRRLGVDDHGLLEVAGPAVGGPVLVVEPLQHH